MAFAVLGMPKKIEHTFFKRFVKRWNSGVKQLRFIIFISSFIIGFPTKSADSSYK